MRYFKYCNSADAKKVVGGSLRMCSGAWYRHLEDDKGDTVIGDRFETRTSTTLDNWHVPGILTEDDQHVAARIGISITGNVSNVRIGSSVIWHDGGHWIMFCYSQGEEPDPAALKYDAAIEIASPDQFKNAVLATGRADGRPLSELFDLDRVAAGEIGYGERTADARKQAQPMPSPLMKPTRYGGQTEIRLALPARDLLLPDVQYITFTPPDGLLTLVKHDETVPDRLVALDDRRAAAQELLAVIERLHQFELQMRASRGLHSVFSGREETPREMSDREQRLTEEKRKPFIEGMRSSIMSAYWRARLCGVRGGWEFGLEHLTVPIHALRDLSQLLEALWPGAALRERMPGGDWWATYGPRIDPTSGPNRP